MTDKFNKYDVKVFSGSAQTVEEFDALLEVYKKTNPEKYIVKLNNGEFEKFRKGLKNYVPVVEKLVDREPKEVGPTGLEHKEPIKKEPVEEAEEKKVKVKK